MELRKPAPREAQSLPELSVDLDPALLGVVTAVQGLPFPGPGIDAIMYTLRFLRDNPDYRNVLFPHGVQCNGTVKNDVWG